MEVRDIITRLKSDKYNIQLVILIIVILLTILGGQLIIQSLISFKKEDAQTINIAGKQRMLSQKLVAEVLYQINNDANNSESINKIYNEWKNVHYGLQGNMLFNEQKNSRKNTIDNPLQELNDEVEYASMVINSLEHVKEDEIIKFKKNQESFLTEMDNYVKSLEKASQTKLNFLQNVSLLVTLLLILILAFGIVMVAKPIYEEYKRKRDLLDRQFETSQREFKTVRENSKTALAYSETVRQCLQKHDYTKSAVYLQHLEQHVQNMDSALIKIQKNYNDLKKDPDSYLLGQLIEIQTSQ